MVTILLFSVMLEPKVFGRPNRSYVREDWGPRLEELHARFGRNKLIPEAYRLEVLIALSHYPGLADVHIHFELTESRVPATSRPRIATLFGPRHARRYLVTISRSRVWGTSKAMIANQSFDARIGLIGHELAHTVSYHQKPWWAFIGLGFRMLTPRGRARVERATDQRAIDYGLGWQLRQWALELREGFSGTSWLDTYYMTPAEIEHALGGS